MPIAELVIEIIGTVLQEHADRLGGGGTDHTGIAVAAADVREAADVTEYLAEHIGPLPGHGEGANGARAGSGDGPAGRVGAQIEVLGRLRQDFLLQKPSVLIAERV